MGMFVHSSSISYSVISKTDSRFNFYGSYEGMSCLCQPKEVEYKIGEMEKEYGERPKDLEYSCMKD